MWLETLAKPRANEIQPLHVKPSLVIGRESTLASGLAQSTWNSIKSPFPQMAASKLQNVSDDGTSSWDTFFSSLSVVCVLAFNGLPWPVLWHSLFEPFTS